MNTISGKDCRQKRRGGAGRHESARRRRVGPERGVFVLVGGVGGRRGGDRRAYLRDRDGFEDRRNVMRRRGGVRAVLHSSVVRADIVPTSASAAAVESVVIV